MTNKEYLNQAYRLNERINSDLKELDELRALAVNIGSPSIGERVSGSHSTEAPFARASLTHIEPATINAASLESTSW